LKVNNIADDISDYRLSWKKRRVSNLMRNKMTLEYLAKFECEIWPEIKTIERPLEDTALIYQSLQIGTQG
jgi:hypothetical protein